MVLIKKHYIIGGACILGGLLIALWVGVGLTNANKRVTESADQTQADTKPAASTYADARLYKIGDTVQYQSQSMRVNSVKSSDSISSTYSSPIFADKGTKFIVVNLTVTNNTTNPFMYDPFTVVDQKDRLFNAYEETIGNIEDYLRSADLAPSIPKTGNEVYQVPQDSAILRMGGHVGNTDKLLFVQFPVN